MGLPLIGESPLLGVVTLAAFLRQLVERVNVHRRVDRLDVTLKGVPAAPGGRVEGIANKVRDAGRHDRLHAYVPPAPWHSRQHSLRFHAVSAGPALGVLSGVLERDVQQLSASKTRQQPRYSAH